jgi:soluble lytic murein transglycosylase-like protein
MRDLLRQFSTVAFALAAYNAGPAHHDRLAGADVHRRYTRSGWAAARAAASSCSSAAWSIA